MSTPASDAHAHTTIEIPASQPMVALLGPGDEYLRLIEGAFPEVDILVRGNEVTLDGSAEEVGTSIHSWRRCSRCCAPDRP